MIHTSELLLILGIFSFFVFLIFIVFRGKNNNSGQEQDNLARFWEKIEQLQLDNERLQNLLQKAEIKLEKLESKQEFLTQENLDLKQEVTTFEARENQQESEFQQKIEKLDKAESLLKKEQNRLEKEDIAEKEALEADKFRIWNEHEQSVLSSLKNTTQNLNWPHYQNNSAHFPADFPTNLKPDFFLPFLNQYLIFDAKKSKNPETYFKENSKQTALKYKNHNVIYKTVFFVFPYDEISQLKQTFILESGISFFAISPESIPVILRVFQKISQYQTLHKIDPTQREKITHFLLDLENHINLQNATNLILTQKSAELLKSRGNLDLNADIKLYQDHKKIKVPTLHDILPLMVSDKQETMIQSMIAPTLDLNIKKK